MIELVWEAVKTNHDTLYRAKVFGGWLVRVDNDVISNPTGDMGMGSSGYEWRTALTFIPDVNHEWGKENSNG